MNKGFIISLEGGEGAGKTTILEKLVAWLEYEKVDYLTTREPGGVRISEKIRELLLDKENTDMDPRTEALLFAAARRQHLVQKVLPALNENKVVIFDRYVDSSLVYQGYVRGISIDEVFKLNEFAIEGILPDVTLYFDLDPKIGLQRISDGDREVNRLDLEHFSFHEKVREGYLLLKDRFDRFKVIDASQSIEGVFSQVKAEIIKAGIVNE
ncbi:MAG: dTMP kinase [Clostridia bacterium]|nr:dTMP kinase [Clostridia bacterium]